MANVKHSTLTGTDLHEPKGISTASVNSVYVADGAGSGDWKKDPSSVYGRATFSGNTTETTISAQNTWAIINPTTFTTTLSGISFSTDKFVITTKGIYQIGVFVTFKSVTASKDFTISVGDGTATKITGAAELTAFSDGNLHSLTGMGFLELDASDEINMIIKNITDSVNVIVGDALFTLILMKETT